jgi:hypothetical protein
VEGETLCVYRVCVLGVWACRQCRACCFPFAFSPVFLRICISYAATQTFLVFKYILPEYPEQYLYYGYANVAQNIAIMISTIVLWVAQNTSGEYEYNLTL